jgi:hypothetical protein
MKTLLRWACFGVLLCGSLCIAQVTTNPPPILPALRTSPSTVTRDVFDKWNLFFAGMAAVGTLAVAILAIFGQRVRSWFIRPKIKLAVAETSPFVERFEEEDTSVGGEKRTIYHVRIEVTNTGKEIARNCMILCNAVHRQRAGGAGFYELKQFVPKQFFWTSREQRLDVVPKIPSYVNIAEISEPSPSVKGTGGAAILTQKECLQILVEAEGVKGRFFRVENGKVILPAILYADNLPHPIKQFLEISWSGTCVKDFSPSKFQVRLLDEKQGNALLGGAQ